MADVDGMILAILRTIMDDFANFNKDESFFRPYATHLDVYARFRHGCDTMDGSENWKYKVKIFCAIPIILFQGPNSHCNILIHLNYKLLAKLNATSWLNSKRLTFMILISVAGSQEVVSAKTISLTGHDSDSIRRACLNQRNYNLESVENLVDVVYQQNIRGIWPESKA